MSPYEHLNTIAFVARHLCRSALVAPRCAGAEHMRISQTICSAIWREDDRARTRHRPRRPATIDCHRRAASSAGASHAWLHGAVLAANSAETDGARRRRGASIICPATAGRELGCRSRTRRRPPIRRAPASPAACSVSAASPASPGRASASRSSTPASRRTRRWPTRVVANVSFVTGDPRSSDAYGHGTHVAGIIAGSGARHRR